MGRLAKLLTIACSALVAIVLIASSARAAEHPMAAPESIACPGAQPEQGGGPPPMVGCGMKCREHCPEMVGMPMMEACRSMMPTMHEMMDPMMSPFGMGMKGMMGAPHDPKAVGRMLQMRGDVLKAVGEVLLKYGREMAGEGK